MKFTKNPIATAVSIALLTLAMPVFAQTAATKTPEMIAKEEAEAKAKAVADKKAGTAQEVERIVVTSGKRAEAAYKVPYNVSALSEETMREENITDVKKLIQQSVAINAPQNSARFADSVTVRGLNISPVSANNLEQFAKTTIAYYLDETPLPSIGFRIKDVARVETLLGPQGTLYGAGSLGGTIRYITNKPRLDKTEGRLSSGLYQTKGGGISNDTDVMFNFPLSETFALRGSYAHLDEKGYTDRVSNPPWRLGTFAWTTQPDGNRNRYENDDWQKVDGGRLALLWKVSNDATITFSHAEQRQNANGTTGTSLLPCRVANAITPAQIEAAWKTASANCGTATTPETRTYFNPLLTPFAVGQDVILSRYGEFAIRNFKMDSVELDVDLGFARLASSTSQFTDGRVGQADYASQGQAYYFGFGDLGGKIDSGRSAFITYNNAYKGFSHETRLVSKNDGPLNWIAGLYYTDQEKSLRFSEMLPGLDAYNKLNRASIGGIKDEGYFENLANKYSETAVFGEVNYKVTPKWTATVGARAFQYKDTAVARIVDYAGGYVDSDYTRSGGKKSKSYFKLNTSYQFADDLLGYATFSQGFRRGGTNGFKDIGTKKVSDANASYQPDSTNNFELGLKGYALNRMLYIETGVYQIDWKNVQTYRSQDVEGFPVNGTANGPDARSRGFEFSSRYKLSDNWQATYSSTTTQAEWSGTVVNCLFANSTTDQCRTWEKGGKLGGSPKWKHNFGARFNTYLDNGTYLWASLSGRYTGPIAIDRADSPTSSVRERPAYTLLNANSGISFGNWDANFWIQNLVNKRAEVSAQEAGLMGARLRFATPRTMGVNVTYYFK